MKKRRLKRRTVKENQHKKWMFHSKRHPKPRFLLGLLSLKILFRSYCSIPGIQVADKPKRTDEFVYRFWSLLFFVSYLIHKEHILCCGRIQFLNGIWCMQKKETLRLKVKDREKGACKIVVYVVHVG
ncbi:hypothetical protein BDF20DRAFT_834415 [Mycotypha africana]|uniref:uncharacterized protein n=1 Tax=Mycotypha africana TaxID=64632 RepID=UPI002300A005|nr:uncharacterized protein BDF20DRAFT_834415 [Mycotypha africana]KAI8981726.1 hypothetical protein BDF20DRAFT_834415 [Mycotypha africana]